MNIYGFFNYPGQYISIWYTQIYHEHSIFITCDLAGRERTKQLSELIELRFASPT